jgi:hypothetical protein
MRTTFEWHSTYETIPTQKRRRVLWTSPRGCNRRTNHRRNNHTMGNIIHRRNRLRKLLLAHYNNHLWDSDGCWSRLQIQPQSITFHFPFLDSQFAASNIAFCTDTFVVPLGKGDSVEKPKKNQANNEEVKN